MQNKTRLCFYAEQEDKTLNETTVRQLIRDMGTDCSELTQIRSKDGVSVYRVKSGNGRYVLKAFDNAEYCREIENYLILNGIRVPTIGLIACTDNALLMEDLEFSDEYRLAAEEDMADETVAAALAKWYRRLHDRGRAYVADHGGNMYMECGCITGANLEFIKRKTNTGDNPVWRALDERLHRLRELIDAMDKTLVYNDFYYTNMAVSRDGTRALMFDYNLLGKGPAAGDIRNVTYSLSKSARESFLDSYGDYDEGNAALNSILEHLVTLYFACVREAFPQWGAEALGRLKNGELLKRLEELG